MFAERAAEAVELGAEGVVVLADFLSQRGEVSMGGIAIEKGAEV